MFGHRREDDRRVVKQKPPNEADYQLRSKVTSSCVRVPVTPVKKSWCVTAKRFRHRGSLVLSSHPIIDTKRPASIDDTPRAPRSWHPFRMTFPVVPVVSSTRINRNRVLRLILNRNNLKRKIRSSSKGKIHVQQGGRASHRRRRVVNDSFNEVERSKIVTDPVVAEGWLQQRQRRHHRPEVNVVAPPSTPPVRRLTPGADVNDVATKVRTSNPSWDLCHSVTTIPLYGLWDLTRRRRRRL